MGIMYTLDTVATVDASYELALLAVLAAVLLAISIALLLLSQPCPPLSQLRQNEPGLDLEAAAVSAPSALHSRHGMHETLLYALRPALRT